MTGDTGGGVESLYPFLFAGDHGADSVLADAALSTGAKAAEIAALRRSVLETQAPALDACARALAGCFGAGGKLLVFGNGGSSTDAAGIANLFIDPPWGRALPAVALTAERAVLTALANDVGFDVVFSRQLAAHAGPVDAALGMSTSGGSENVMRGLAEARRLGLVTVGMAGYDGGRMAEAGMLDHLFVVPSSSVHRIQEAQTTLYHVLWTLTQQALIS